MDIYTHTPTHTLTHTHRGPNPESIYPEMSRIQIQNNIYRLNMAILFFYPGYHNERLWCHEHFVKDLLSIFLVGSVVENDTHMDGFSYM